MKTPFAKDPRERLVYHVQELERLDAVKQQAAHDFRAALAGAHAAGFDLATLKVVLRLRKMTPVQRKERRALEAIYLAALGMLEGDPLTDEARRRLDEQDRPAPPRRDNQPPPQDGKDEIAPPPPEPPPQPPLVFKTPEEAREEGREAAAAGRRIYDNPFPAGDPCRAAWDEGWCERRKSHGMDTPTAYQRRSEPKPDPEKKDKDGKGAAA